MRDNYMTREDISPLQKFQIFLDEVERCDEVRPMWWDHGKRMACERQALEAEGVDKFESKDGLIEKYGDRLMPMRLRMLAENAMGCRAHSIGGW